MGATAGKKLKEYLDFAGILTCNVNPYLPSLSDIGCGWEDVTALIDRHELFYCRAYRKRTVYLSCRAYFLLKQCRSQKPLKDSSSGLYDLFQNGKSLEMTELKTAAHCKAADFTKDFNFLLENLYLTAYRNGKVLNPNWSTLVYCNAETWEKSTKSQPPSENPEAELREILLRTMPEDELHRLLK